MKKITIILLITLLASRLISASAKPPKLVRVEIVNRSGEDITVSLIGMAYDFASGEFVGNWGIVRPGIHYFSVPGTIRTQLLTGQTVITRLPESIYEAHILKDLYIISVHYEQESTGETVCLNNWLPIKYQGDAAYYSAHKANNKLVIKPCNAVPTNLGSPEDGVTKYNRLFMITLRRLYRVK